MRSWSHRAAPVSWCLPLPGLLLNSVFLQGKAQAHHSPSLPLNTLLLNFTRLSGLAVLHSKAGQVFPLLQDSLRARHKCNLTHKLNTRKSDGKVLEETQGSDTLKSEGLTSWKCCPASVLHCASTLLETCWGRTRGSEALGLASYAGGQLLEGESHQQIPSSPAFSPEFHISHSPIAWDRN